MSVITTPKASPQAPHEHYVLEAVPLETGAPEIGTPWSLENVSPKRLFKAPKRHKYKPRRKTTEVLIKTAEKAGLAVTAINADGSISTGEVEALNEHVNGIVNPWKKVPN